MDMPRGDKSKYTGKQERKAEHIEEGYEKRGVGKKEAKRRAWATVNKETGGGNKSGSGRGKKDTNVSAKKGGRIGAALPHRARRQRVRPPPKRALRHGPANRPQENQRLANRRPARPRPVSAHRGSGRRPERSGAAVSAKSPVPTLKCWRGE